MEIRTQGLQIAFIRVINKAGYVTHFCNFIPIWLLPFVNTCSAIEVAIYMLYSVSWVTYYNTLRANNFRQTIYPLQVALLIKSQQIKRAAACLYYKHLLIF